MLHRRQPSLLINWVIRGDFNKIPKESNYPDSLVIHYVTDWSEIFSRIEIESTLKKTKTIFIFPTFHFLSEKDIKKIKDIFNIPVISCLEYSYESSKSFRPDIIAISTGLAEDEMGVFIFPPDEKSLPLAQIAEDQPIKGVLLGHASFDLDIESKTKIYHETHWLFFGYANSEVSRVIINW